jgi:hypothetical protein
MGVQKEVLKRGNETDFPKKHDEVCMEYTGKLRLYVLIATKQLLKHPRMAF